MVPCQLPYPGKYEKALDFYRDWPQDAGQPSTDTQLLLYALSSQVAHGPCQQARPSSWNTMENSKWTAWSGLGQMDKMEAMRLFVKTLEEEEPAWYSILEASNGRGGSELGGANGTLDDPTSPSAASAGAASATRPQSVRAVRADDTWRSPWIAAERHPYPRFEHAACLLGSTMFVFGGNAAGGRYLSDVWQLDLEALAWTDVTGSFAPVTDPDDADAPPGGLPPLAAAVALTHRGRILLVGGHTKARGPRGRKDPTAPLRVRVLDPARGAWGALRTSGDAPLTRGGHAAAVVADRLFVFGGEGPTRRLLEGVKVLDLGTLEWSDFELEGSSGPGPSPRSGLVATAYQDRYIVTFGGGAIGQCHGDIWVLDTHARTWAQPALLGPTPAPRAGCAAALLGNRWYVVGGGNNAAGCPNMWMLDLLHLGVDPLLWECVCSFDARSALASEGASVVAAPGHSALIAFGGYNGAHHNAVSVFRPRDAAAVAAAASTPHFAPSRSYDAAAAATGASPPGRRSPEIQPAELHPTGGQAPGAQDRRKDAQQLDAAHKATAAALEEAAMAKEVMKEEVALMRNQLEAAQTAQAAAEAAARELEGALAAEKDRAFKLEVELSEVAGRVQAAEELEREVQKLRGMMTEREKKGSGGIWGYISGA